MSTLKQSIAIAFLASTMAAGAVPAKRGLQTVIQPDGTEIMVQRVGDEHLHFLISEDGRLLTKNIDGTYVYANMTIDGKITATGIVAVNPAQLTEADAVKTTMLSDIDLDAVRNLRTAKQMRMPAQSGLGRYTSDFPRTGDIRALVILVQYKDVSFTLSDPKTYFENMLNQKGFSQYGGTGSATDYFLDSSTNQFRPVFDVFGPVTLPQNRSYYGDNDSSGYDLLPEDMIVHACQALDATVDFSKYDMDGDGYVDNVYVFYAGQGEASYGSESTVWPHSWELSSAGKALKLDGVYIDRYACSNEWESSRPDGIGTFVHEFSHVMGLPDLYHTTSASAYYTPWDYDVLDYGPYNNDGRTPPVYSAFERNAMGWIDPIVITEAESITLENLGTSNQAVLIPTSKTNEFFLLENRQKTGWDAYIPGHGMLIWHVDFNQSVWDNNVVNNTKSHQYVDIEEANGNPDGSSTTAKAGWTWPGTGKKTSFTDSTSPSMQTWAKANLNLPITDIAETNGVITFNVAGGKVLIETPVAQDPTTKYSDSFVATWLPVENAIDYHLSVWYTEGGAEETETVNMGSKTTTATFPNGWSASTTATYSSSGNYGEASPSLKLASDGAYLQTKEYEGDITKVTFWHKGQNTNNSSSTIQLQNYEGKSWKTFATVTPQNNNSATAEITDIPAGTRQLRIAYAKSTGNLALDDVVITYGGSADVLIDEYDERSLGNVTEHHVKDLPEGKTKFKYAVCATDGTNHSKMSAKVTVDLSEASAISDINADNANVAPVYYNLQGMPVTNPLPGQILIRQRGAHTDKIIVK